MIAAHHLIAAREVNTLVLVHRQQLLEQWVERLSSFLDLPAKSNGRLGGGHKKLTDGIDVALIQSLVRKSVVDDRVVKYGHLIVDECHHLSAQSFERVASRAKARFVLGLSATVARRDGLIRSFSSSAVPSGTAWMRNSRRMRGPLPITSSFVPPAFAQWRIQIPTNAWNTETDARKSSARSKEIR